MTQQPPPQFATDAEAVNALQFRQPNGTEQFGLFATHVYHVLRKVRQFEIPSAYQSAVNVANMVFGPIDSASGTAGPTGEGVGSAAAACNCQAEVQPEISNADDTDDSAAATLRGPVDPKSAFSMHVVDFSSFRCNYAAQLQHQIITDRLRDRGGAYSDEPMPETADASEFAVRAVDDMIRALISKPTL